MNGHSSQFNRQRRRQLRLLDQLCDQYELICQSDSPADLKSFLASHEDKLTSEIVDELIRIDLDHRADIGKSVEIDEYAERLEPYQSAAYRVFSAIENDDVSDPSSSRVWEKTYEVREKIGAGGMAQIYRGFDHRLNRPVAIKMLRRDLDSDHVAVERFENEAKMMAALRHEGIVQVYDVGVRNETLMIVLELMEGGTLREKIAQQSLSIQQCAEYAKQISAIIHQAHEIGVIHLDLKPSNILLTKSGLLKVGDFGLARLADKSPSGLDGEIFGTVNYMAPEQAKGQSYLLDRRTDVYGIGAVLYEMLTGRPPFEGDSNQQTIEQLIHHQTEPPRKLRRNIPIDLDRICMKCLNRNPIDRYQTAQAIENDLTAFIQGRPTTANPPGPVGRLRRWVRRNTAVAATVAIACLLLIVMSIALVSRIVDERNRFKNQRDVAISNLYDSLVGQARAIRLAGGNGYRIQAYEKIRQAIALDAPNINRMELRNEVVASMGNFIGQQPTIWKCKGTANMFVSSAIDPDGLKIYLGLFDGRISIRRISDGHELQNLPGHQSGVFEIAVSPQGDRMASVDDRGQVKVWKKNENDLWKSHWQLDSQPTARPQYVKSHSLVFSPDGQTLFCCPLGKKSIERWELDEKQTEMKQPESEYQSATEIIRFSMSSDATLFVIGTVNNEIVVWNRQARKIERTIQVRNARQLLDVAISPDKQWLAVGTFNGVYVFDLATGEQVMSLPGDHLITLSFSPDSQLLALPSEDLNLVRLWHVRSKREIAVLENDAYEATFSNDGRILTCVSAGQVAIWDLRESPTPIKFAAQKKGVNRLVFSPNGLLFSSDIDRNFAAYDMSSVVPQNQLKLPLQIFDCFHGAKIAVMANENYVEFYRLPIGSQSKLIHRFPHELGPKISDAKLTRRGQHLVIAGSGGVKIWSVSVEKSAAKLSLSFTDEKTVFQELAGSLVTSDDQQLMAWVDRGGSVHAWDLKANQSVASSGLKGGLPDCLAFLPGTHTLISADVYGVVRKLDLGKSAARPEPLATSVAQKQAEWQTVRLALAPNGRWLCIQRGTKVVVWDLKHDRELFSLPESDALAWSMVWDSSSSRVALGYADGSVVVWQLDMINDQLRPLGLNWE